MDIRGLQLALVFAQAFFDFLRYDVLSDKLEQVVLPDFHLLQNVKCFRPASFPIEEKVRVFKINEVLMIHAQPDSLLAEQPVKPEVSKF